MSFLFKVVFCIFLFFLYFSKLETKMSSIQFRSQNKLNSDVQGFLNTNLKFIEPTIYEISFPITLTIFEYKINEINYKNLSCSKIV